MDGPRSLIEHFSSVDDPRIDRTIKHFQVKVDHKSDEITAISQLLEVLDIAGCIVTIDAMGCQIAIA